ncbi:MAG: Rieske 2Fe-2S domain-containing protein, partial [Pseudomonadota bacterium]
VAAKLSAGVYLRRQKSIQPYASYSLMADYTFEVQVGDPVSAGKQQDKWESVCAITEIQEGRAKVARLADGSRVAVFRHGGKLSAISNACAHQNGPLGEGRIIKCLVTCPWHGFQYDVTTGRSPAPFTEKVPTYNLRIANGLIEVNPAANPPGTPVEPVLIPNEAVK